MSSRKQYHACSKEGGKKVQRDISAKEKASSQQVDKKTKNRMRAMQKKNWGREQRRNAFLTFCNKPFHQDESRSNINDRITL